MTVISENRFTWHPVRRTHSSLPVEITGGQISNVPVSRAPRSMPASIPVSQRYYWTRRWQTDEQETLDELGRGEEHVFESASDAIHWLLSDDE